MSACESAALVLALLTVESSYIDEVERPRSGVPDTVQFWLGSESQWRVKTFAIDHDIHVYRLGDAKAEDSISQERAELNIRKSYGDVLESLQVICFPEPIDAASSALILREHGLFGALEVAPAGFAFYNPDNARYRTQSEPKQ